MSWVTHHSSAITTSQQGYLKDPEAKKLAEEIIEAQKQEIVQMREIVNRLENGDSGD